MQGVQANYTAATAGPGSSSPPLTGSASQSRYAWLALRLLWNHLQHFWSLLRSYRVELRTGVRLFPPPPHLYQASLTLYLAP